MPKVGGAENAIGGVIPKFYMRPILNEAKSKSAGHAVYDDVEYVEVVILGTNSTKPNYRVTDKYRKKWPKHYEAFKNGTQFIEDGFRLSEWELMTPASVESLSSMGVHTMEQFVELADDTAKYLGVFQLKNKAKKILSNQDDKQSQINSLQEQNDALMKRLEALEAGEAPTKKKKRQISPETKKKMAEGRARAAAKKKAEAEAAEAENTEEPSEE